MVESTFEVVIAGSGLIGASLALALGQAGVRTALIDSEPAPAAAIRPDEPAQYDPWDARIYAVSPASASFLDALGAWRRLDSGRLEACTQMEIFGDRSGSRLAFDAYEAGVPALAHMLESSALLKAFSEALGSSDRVTVLHSDRVADVRRGAASVRVDLASGRSLQCALLIGADGAHSKVRELAGIPSRQHDYRELAVVANFAATEPHFGTAFQWFRGDSVLALLPLPGKRVSLVWSAHESDANKLLALSDTGLADAVSAATARRLGRLDVITRAKSFPLTRITVPDPVADRIALIGDAAHVVHPLAGQGVNLGFGDAEALARVIMERGPIADIGSARLLRRYRRRRAEPIIAMLAATHGLHALFELPGAFPTLLRNAGLNLTQRLPVLRSLLARRAMG
ncbi:MAG: FAD-dependent monooxygenase [Burkholderiales bacterium]